MMRKSTLIKITQKHPLHMTAVPVLNPAQPLYNGIISLEGFPCSAQIGELKLIPTMLYSSHADYRQKLYHDLFNKQTAEVRKIIMSSPEHMSMVFTELNISNCCACTKLHTYPGWIGCPGTPRDCQPADSPHLIFGEAQEILGHIRAGTACHF